MSGEEEVIYTLRRVNAKGKVVEYKGRSYTPTGQPRGPKKKPASILRDAVSELDDDAILKLAKLAEKITTLEKIFTEPRDTENLEEKREEVYTILADVFG